MFFTQTSCSHSMSAEYKTCQYLQGSIPQNTATSFELGGGRLKINPLQKPTWRGEFTDAYTLILKCDRQTGRKGELEKNKNKKTDWAAALRLQKGTSHLPCKPPSQGSVTRKRCPKFEHGAFACVDKQALTTIIRKNVTQAKCLTGGSPLLTP